MENNSLNLFPYFNENNVYMYREAINYAKESHNWPLMIQLINVCLPPEVIRKYISPHFSEPITNKYRHKLITYKLHNNFFQKTVINYDNDINKWGTFSRHNGTYSVVPKIDSTYVMWDEKTTKRRKAAPHGETLYTYQLLSQCNTYNDSCFLIENQDKDNKKLIFGINEEPRMTIKPHYQPSHYYFSSDCKLLTIGFKRTDNLSSILLYDFNSYNYNAKKIQKYSFSINGDIAVLCSAHHSPIFVAGSNSANTPDLHNILLFTASIYGRNLHGHDAPITCIEFSPDDTRLLTCSYNEITGKSQLRLWNTSDLNNIHYIYDQRYTNHTLKAFFICDGQRIVTINKNGHMGLFDGLAGQEIRAYYYLWSDGNRSFNGETSPLCLWSNKNNLFINTFKNKIKIRKSTTGKDLGSMRMIKLKQTPIGIGLTADESTIVFIDEEEQVYQLELYSKQDYNEINFIKNANIVQLFTLFNICEDNKGAEKITSFVETIKSYIQEQQKKQIK